MRKILVLFLAILLIFSLYGCDPYTQNIGKGSQPSSPDPAYTHTQNATQPTTSDHHIHNYFGQKVSATCTDSGYMLHICACGDQFTDSHTDPLGHNWTDWSITKYPTETESGLQERICQLCSAADQQILAKLEANHQHSYTTQTVEPTCIDSGLTVFTCSCGHTYSEPGAAALGHSFTNYQSNNDAQCTTDGTKTAICDRCHCLSTIADEGSAPGHDWEAWIITKEPTTTQEGQQSRTCAACGAVDNQIIDKIPAVHSHSYTETIVPASCTSDGYTLYSCVCGDSYRDHPVSATGHSWGQWLTTKEPTVTAEGQKTRTCQNCSATDNCTLERLPAVHEHEYEKEKVSATCTQGAYTNYVCECGESYQETTSEPKGHQWGNWFVTVDPTTEDAGQRQRICEVCEDTENGTVSKLLMEGGFAFVYWTETIGRNMQATVIIKGQPGVKYNIDVIYSSGPSTAKGLENKVADENGYVTWNWKIGPSTAGGTYKIRVSGGGDKQTVYFTIIVE